MRRFAYGFGREQKDFAAVEYDDLVLDTDRQRVQLAELIKDGLRTGAGDVIVILGDADIPARGPMRAAIKAKKATIEVVGLTPRKGRPPKFDPDEKTLQRIREIWNTPYFESYATKLISQELGREVSRFTLRRQLGKRDFGDKK